MIILWVMLYLVVGLCMAELLLRGMDRLLKRRWDRRRERRVIAHGSWFK